ncbi:uncharacterized protein LOC120342868 [Styela clava]
MEGLDENSAMSITLDNPVTSSAEKPQDLETAMADLRIDLQVANSKLDEVVSENEQLRMKLEEQDVFEMTEVKNLIADYENQIKALKQGMTSSGQSNLLQKVEEVSKLKQKNNILSCTNAQLFRQFESAEKERQRLENELMVLNNTSGLVSEREKTFEQQQEICQSGSGENISETENKKECESCKEKAKYILELKHYLSQYYELVIKNQTKAQEFEKKNEFLEENTRKLTEQMQAIVEERDKLQLMLRVKNQESRSFVSVQPSTSTQEYQSPAEGYDMEKFEHYKNLVVEFKDKCRDLEHKLSEKEDHILEQEAKMQKMMINISDIQKERDAARSLIISNEHLQAQTHELHCLRQGIQEKEKYISELEIINNTLKSQLDTFQNDTKSGENSLYEEQIKAFQDDYFAEREEKQRIIEEKERLRRENENMRLELGNRSSTVPGQNPTYEATLRSPPPSGVHQSNRIHHQNSATSLESVPPSLPNAGHSHQVIDYNQMRPSQITHPSHGTIPNSGMPIYHASQSYPGYGPNTIPPRGQPTYYHQSPPTDQPPYYMSPPPNFPPNDQMVGYPNVYGSQTNARQMQQGTGPSPNNTQNRQTPR